MLHALLPTACPVCGARGAAPCPRCARQLRRASPGPVPAGVDVCAALLAYDGAARQVVAALKFRSARTLVPVLADGLAALVGPGRRPHAVTWAPTTPSRRRGRGFDQAELLGRAVARRLGVPARRLLARHEGPPQTGRTWQQRQGAPRFAAVGIVPAHVLVVDDVTTTGATLTAAARALRAAGAKRVDAVNVARTPLKKPGPMAEHSE